MDENEFTTIRIKKSEYDWIKSRAEAHHRGIGGELSAIRDLIEYFEKNTAAGLDVLPRPEGGATIPVIEQG